MIENIETLRALSHTGTMTGAATRLRITQSAVSKRIAALEAETGKRLIEPMGRRVRLTPSGIRLLEKTGPLLAELRAALKEEASGEAGRLVLAVSESVLASWGARVLERASRRIAGLELVLNAHRSVVAVDRVRSGECMLGICAGVADEAPDLSAEILIEEEFALVPSRLDVDSLKLIGRVPILSIEHGSATWVHLSRRIKRAQSKWRFELVIERTLQSYSGLVQMARAGFGHALVPLELARAVGIPASKLVTLPSPGLRRPVSLVGRPTGLAQPGIRRFVEILREEIRDRVAGGPPEDEE